MSCQICDCNSSGMNNTGFACVPIFYSTKKIIFVPTYKSDGTKNYIASSDTLNQAYFDAKIASDTPADERWYPSPSMKNVVDERAEPTYETFDDLSTVFIQEAVRKFLGEITVLPEIGAVAPQLKGKLESSRCTQFSVYYIDTNGNLIGKYEGTDKTKLYPEAIDAQSLYVGYMKTSLKNKTSQKLILTFNVNTTEKDQDYAMIQCSDLNGVVLLDLRGLVDVSGTYSDIGTDGFTIATTTDFGTFKNPGYWTGLVAADFIDSNPASLGQPAKVYNLTTDTSVAVTVAESPDGTYAVTLATPQSPGDEIRVYIYDTGADFTEIYDNPVTIAAS